ISFSSLSKAYLAPGWRTGWMAIGRTERLGDALEGIKKPPGGRLCSRGRPGRLDEVLKGIKKLADGRLCSNGPTEHAIVAALTGDRSHEATFRAALRGRADVTVARLNAIEGMHVVAPTAAFYAMPRVTLPAGVTDEQYVLGLLRATGVLVVYGSGFGTRPGEGFFRVCF